ncbi:hypothetical protein CQ012_15960 [Arthrobacter sp. MYb214]|uniref:hypothetical protein n=1 Tax=unclassified Arthrobacter TaxID=235627 RepID=UPI000CFA8D91|nr:MULTISPECIES: hypothetical protein [unclassified Arthrobacter]PQZ85851.1 hypothetical protein CQ016_12800 [Arthrobacter sp. MYb222]PRB73926.1 hypothetical protein CQ012_15960 [Arthrobacter sp. MYb214]
MKPYLPRAARNYLEQLRRALDFLSLQERNEVIETTKQEILRLPGGGRRKSDLIRLLGEPASRALKFERHEPEALEVGSGKYFLTRILAWPIFALALLTLMVVLFAPPQAALANEQSFGFVAGGVAGLLGQLELLIGSQLIWLAFIPVILSLVPLWLPNSAGTTIHIVGAVIMTVICAAGGGQLSLFFIPVTVLLWAQVFTPLLMMRGSMASPGPGWLVCAAVLLILVLGYASYQGLASFSAAPWLILAPAALLAVLAMLLPFRWKLAHIALVAAGLLVMAAGFVAALPGTYGAVLAWPWLAGSMSFAVGHLALAAGMWHERARKLLALF